MLFDPTFVYVIFRYFINCFEISEPTMIGGCSYLISKASTLPGTICVVCITINTYLKSRTAQLMTNESLPICSDGNMNEPN